MNILVVGNTTPNQTDGPIYFNKNHVNQIKKAAPTAQVTLTNNAQKSLKTLQRADIVLRTYGYPIDYKKATSLKWVHSASAGVSDVIEDLKGIDVLLTNSSGVAPLPISEWVAGVCLMFTKRLHITMRNQITKKRWMRDNREVGGSELATTTCGIVGYGRIGGQIGKLTKALGMNVVALVHDKKIMDKTISRTYKRLDELLKASDFVINCLPLTPATKGFFSLQSFKQMKKTAYFINIGRGPTVVEKDLIYALKNRIIAGAGLDVTEVEPLPDSSPLWNLENVILTPHVSSWTPKYTDRVIDIFCENLKAYTEDKAMPNLVDKQRGY